MGNTIPVKLKEDTKMLEITEKLIRDFQYHIHQVDKSVVDFARSIDSLKASFVVYKQHKGEAVDTHFDVDINVPACPVTASVFEMLEKVVSDHKMIAIESTSRLFSFIIGTGRRYLTSNSETTLSVDNYRLQNYDFPEMSIRLCYVQIDSLHRKIKAINADYEIAKQDIDNFNKREESYQEEQKILNENIQDLNNELVKMADELKKSLNANDVTKQRTEELKKEVNSLSCKIRQSNRKVCALEKQIQVLIANTKKELDSLKWGHKKLKIRFQRQMDTHKSKMCNEDNLMLIELLEKETKNKEEHLKQLHNLIENHSQCNDETFSQLIDETMTLKKDVEKKQKQIESLQLQLELVSRKVLQVQICTYPDLYEMRAARAKDELQNMLKTKMATENIDLQFINCSKTLTAKSRLPMLIFCFRNYFYPRKNNISLAIEGLKETQKKTALVMFLEHNSRTHADNQNDDEEKIRGIFDIGYNDVKYESDTNFGSIDGMIKFLKSEAVQHCAVV